MKTRKWLMVATFILLTACIGAPVFAAPRGGGGGRSGRSELGERHEGFRGGFHDGGFGRAYTPRVYVAPYPGWYFDWGWGPGWIWGPYPYPGPDVVEVRHVNYGTLDFKVKPVDTQIYVDNKFIGTVKSLDHHKAYVKQGDHEITLKFPDGRTVDRNIYVAAGKKIKIDDTP
jgi:hypothetical protein